MSISSSSMLVELNISVWTAAVVDRRATDKVTHDAHASADAGLFRKNLTAGTSLRKDIADYAALCRTWHNGRTLPWADRGPRLLPTSMFFDYKKEANARRDYFSSKKGKFIADYPQLLAEAPYRLGDLYNPADFPTVEEVASKFAFNLVFSPVPEAGDFRLDLPKSELEEMREQYDVAYESRVGEAMKTTWEKLHTMLTGMSERLTENEADDGKRKMFRNTFLSNAQEMCQLLTHLNITNNPELEQARRELETAISGYDIDDIKEDVGARTELKAKLDAALGRYEW